MNKTFPDAPTIDFEHGDHDFTVKIITKKERYLCPIDGCFDRYLEQQKLTYHISQCHGLSARKTHYCQYCGEGFRGKYGGNTTNEYCSTECRHAHRRAQNSD